MYLKYISKNFSKYVRKNNLGFTLVELITVIMIFVILSGIVVGILFSALRSYNKANIANAVSQAGSYSLSVITNTIVKAESVVSVGASNTCIPSASGNSIVVKYVDDPAVTNNAARISCGGNIQVEEGGVDGAGTFTPITSYTIIDNSAIALSSCSFTCTQQDYSPPSVQISISLVQRNSSALPEFSSSSNFNTTVSLRNYKARW